VYIERPLRLFFGFVAEYDTSYGNGGVPQSFDEPEQPVENVEEPARRIPLPFSCVFSVTMQSIAVSSPCLNADDSKFTIFLSLSFFFSLLFDWTCREARRPLESCSDEELCAHIRRFHEVLLPINMLHWSHEKGWLSAVMGMVPQMSRSRSSGPIFCQSGMGRIWTWRRCTERCAAAVALAGCALAPSTGTAEFSPRWATTTPTNPCEPTRSCALFPRK